MTRRSYKRRISASKAALNEELAALAHGWQGDAAAFIGEARRRFNAAVTADYAIELLAYWRGP